MIEKKPGVAWYSIEELAIRCGVEVATVREFCVQGLLDIPPGEPRLPPETSLRVQRIVRLKRDLGVNLEGVAVILDLLDRIEELEAELSHLRRR